MFKDVIRLFGVWQAMCCTAVMKGFKVEASRLLCSIAVMLPERHTAVC